MIPALAAVLLLAQASPLPTTTVTRTVHAAGEGRVTAAPDVARVVLGVEAQDPSLSRANADATSRMKKVLAALEKAGIAPLIGARTIPTYRSRNLDASVTSIQEFLGPGGP